MKDTDANEDADSDREKTEDREDKEEKKKSEDDEEIKIVNSGEDKKEKIINDKKEFKGKKAYVYEMMGNIGNVNMEIMSKVRNTINNNVKIWKKIVNKESGTWRQNEEVNKTKFETDNQEKVVKEEKKKGLTKYMKELLQKIRRMVKIRKLDGESMNKELEELNKKGKHEEGKMKDLEEKTKNVEMGKGEIKEKEKNKEYNEERDCTKAIFKEGIEEEDKDEIRIEEVRKTDSEKDLGKLLDEKTAAEKDKDD